MRLIEPKKAALPTLLVSALLAATFLPAGAEPVIAPGGESQVRSQELVFCETDASGQITGVRVIDMLGLKKGARSLDIRKRYTSSRGRNLPG